MTFALTLFIISSQASVIGGLLVKSGSQEIFTFPENTRDTHPGWILELESYLPGDNVNYILQKDGSDPTHTKFLVQKINTTNSWLKQNHSFDYEVVNDRQGKFIIAAIGSGGVLESRKFQMKLEDVNDNTPEFTNLPDKINVSEATGVDADIFTIEGQDLDGTSDFNIITFSIADGDPKNYFSLHYLTQTSVSVRISSPLDHDFGQDVYNLTINATDKRTTVNPLGLWNVSYLTIQITDADDLGAAFAKKVFGPIHIAENLQPGAFVTQVTATDRDKTVKQQILYSLVAESNTDGIFAINEISGNITLVKSLDRKAQSSYALLVSANSSHHDAVYAQVVIVLDDANVHGPNFTSDVYNSKVPENAEIGTLVLVVLANDLDEGSNAVVAYYLDGEHDPFIINTVNSVGYIYVNGSLDYDVKNYYNFTVVAAEALTSEKYNDSSLVVINVTEILSNEHNPTFNQTSYSANVTENGAPERVVQVTAVDLDQGHYGHITYSIVDGAYGMFSIDKDTGWINATAPLDRELRSSYTLIVRATDGDTFARYTDVLVVVTVLDSNDNAPTLLKKSYSGVVVENSNFGTTVLVVQGNDNDEGANALFEFEIFIDGEFTAVGDGNLGYIIVNGSLDYEKKPDYGGLLYIKETSTAEKKQTSVPITIRVIDVNDNTPIFSSISGYSADIAENTPSGTTVLNVSATDQDSGTFGQVTYSLSTPSVPFSINASTGEIKTTRSLDRENETSYSLTIKAEDGGKPPLSSYSSVIIKVTDVNDNAPKFSQSTYTAEVDENIKIGSSILTVTVTDADEGLNGQIRYYVQGGNNLFDVDTSGVIFVNGTLDYESNTTYSFLVFAEESSTTEAWKANSTVIVNLKDFNEFDPEFTQQSYYGYIKENSPNGSAVATVQAEDQDGVFNVISYIIVSGNEDGYFTINQTSGVVTTSSALNRETNDKFILKIKASDNGDPARTTETFVVIDVFDMNDHSPVFSQSSYNTTIPENLPVGTTILTVKASDQDANSTNSDIRYYVSASNSDFDVTDSGHVFINGSLDYESTSNYKFTIIAEESGTPAKQNATALVLISITDINEYDPVFPKSGFHGNVSENSAIGTSVAQIEASDMDGTYNITTYSIIHGNDAGSFFINGSSGLVSTATALDRETQSQFILTVKAQDNGNPPRSSEVTLVIDVLDVSDHKPVFLQSSYNATIMENVDVGTTVLTVKAEDKDEGENAKFDYYVVGADGKFDVSSEGAIISTALLDYEASTSHTFLVCANETNTPENAKANVTVTIFIQDVNEFNPVFSKLRYIANVSENSIVGTPVVQVNASDDDRYYGQCTYSIVDGNNGGKFAINSTTGLIITNGPLDRETESQFILSVRAQDNGVSPARTAEVVVVVNIVDLSDHKPVFLQISYNATVFENVAVGTTVLTAMATDNDKGTNAMIRYYITGGDGTFSVTEDGNIVVNSSLDYEGKQRYEFQVIAEESQASTKYNDSADIIIYVQDVNEYNPVFTQMSYMTILDDSSTEGTKVIQVIAQDSDGFYNKTTYSIVHGNGGGVFDINGTTGWISVTNALQGQTARRYTLTVKAEDNGIFPRSAEVLVVISLNETNRNSSFLLQDIYNLTILENAFVGSKVLTLNVRESHKGEISVFSFEILGGDGDFIVTPLGEIEINRALNVESKSSYILTVVVTEIQPPSGLAANATVNIKVVDVNEFNPKFSQDHYHGNVSEGAAPGTSVLQVLATDQDHEYKVLTYSITHGNDGNNFTINSTTGVIKTTTMLDRETKDQFILTVRVQDNGPSARTAEVVVIVDILDISEHLPMFLLSNYSGIVFENAAVGTVVLNVKATDADQVSGSSLTYSVIGGDGKFDVTSDGVIIVNGSLDYEATTMYTFLVTAMKPSPNAHLRANATITITLLDVNEFNPEFNQSAYSAQVNEDVPIGTTVVTVSASDKDKDFSLLTYSIIAGNDDGNVTINNNTGQITIAQPLDRETSHQIVLTVRAEDNGTPARTSEVTVIIGIADSNDNGPVFPTSQYNGSISENAAIGTTILAVQAVDKDSTPSSLNYHIHSEDTFRMETRYGLGFVVVNRKLDYELRKSYSFLVYAEELTVQQRNTSVAVNLTIIDANDNRPVFGSSSYGGTVKEGMPAGTPVINVSASDADSEAFGPVNFEIIEGDPFGNFSIDNKTGHIQTATILDYEVQQTFVLVIEAKDSGLPALSEAVTVTINVLDQNDAIPLFIGSPYTADVPENTQVDTNILTVQAVDKDKGKNGEFVYSLVGADNLFSITQEGNIGHIRVAGSLDYEKNKTFEFHVVANETGGSERKESNAMIVVTLTDVNDNTPVFSRILYEFDVDEDPSFPITVGKVSATDEDSGAFGNVTYFILHGDENGNFTMNNQTGEIETGAILNREILDRYVLIVEARDGGSPALTAVATVIIRVGDQNELPPVFHEIPYEASIDEKKDYSDYPIIKVRATDPDLLAIKYTLDSSSEFTVDENTGVIKATGVFDHEVKSLYNITVTAIDHGGLNTSEHVIIRVTDINDNTPQFLNTPYQITVPDNTTIGMAIITVTATDADSAHNGDIIFSLLGADGKFDINKTSGEITVSGKLDRQLKAAYELRVVATDRGIPQSNVNSTVVMVNLTDNSNGAPIFESVAYVGDIQEDLVNTFVLAVKANDPDDGSFGHMTYSIIGGNTYNAFEINSTGAIFSTMSLDFENDTQKTFDLTVMAVDDGGLKDTTQVRITVLDVNDNAPVIINIPSAMEVNISDNTPEGTLLYAVQAYDLDSGSNGDFEFFANVNPSNLTIDKTTGVIEAKTTLHYSSAESILMEVYVVDRGTPNKSSSGHNITFNIVPNPTIAPFLLPSLTEITVLENASIDDAIGMVNSSETADSFSFVVQLPSAGYFNICKNGSLSLAKLLDREKEERYSLLVKAMKNGQQALGYVSVEVIDVNDENPEFLFDVYKGQIHENLTPGSPVLTVKAVDGDEQGMVTYTISSGNSEGVFNISANGEIQVAKLPDYETTKFFNLTIVASDGVHSSSTFAEITILDVNDNPPKFRNSSYNVTVAEDTPGGTSVLQVSAEDSDGDIIFYSMTGDNGKFMIDTITGVIATTDQRLDYEEQSSFSLNITATDTGGLKSSVVVVVNLTDSNDNKPTFGQLTYNVTVAENYFGILPMKINATDSDSGNNGRVTYSIVGSSTLFSINPLTGEINATAPLNIQKGGLTTNAKCQGVLILNIRASDGGTPTLTDETSVTILVTDVNDNTPVFAKSSYEEIISVLHSGNILLVKASDQDCGVNSDIHYQFTSNNGSDLFQINETTGNITTKKSLNGSVGIYFLNVTASNPASPNLQSSVIVKITVIENKNYAPKFAKPQYYFNIEENATIGYLLGSVSATDVNKGKDGVFIYSIENPDQSIPFDIDPEAGSITLVRKLDREDRENYTFVVVAKDFGDPPLTHTTKVYITVNDINDAIPIFPDNSTFSYSVPEDIATGSLVCFVQAIDADAGKYGDPIYVIHSGNEEGYFRIDNSSGQIYLEKKLDREVINVFQLTIRAYNHGSYGSRRRRDLGTTYSEIQVVINITDINDNAPKFVQTSYVGGFKSSSEPGTKVTTVLAFDVDEGPNSKIFYWIQPGEGDDAFEINSATGLITTKEAASQLTQSKVTLIVNARDSPQQGVPKEANEPATLTIYKLPPDPLTTKVSSGTDRDTIMNILKNITGPGYHVIIDSITPNGLLSDVKYYIVNNSTGTFLTESEIASLITEFCKQNPDVCNKFGINLTQAEENSGSTDALLGEDDITILEAMLLTLGVLIGIGGILGILLLCCLRRRKRYMPVYEPSELILPSKAVSFADRPHYFQPDPQHLETQEVEIHMDEEGGSVDSAEEVTPSSTLSHSDLENTQAIAKVQAYMNQALMDDDTDSDSSDDDKENGTPPRVDGTSSSGSNEPLVGTYTITNI